MELVLEEWVQDGLQPDLTLILDLDPTLAEQRMRARAKDRMESEQLEFYQRVRSGYLARAVTSERYKVIDAGQSMDAVAAAIEVQLTACISDWQTRP